MPQNAFFLLTRDLLVSPKNDAKTLFTTLHPLSTVLFATATVLAFVLLRDSRFNFHCYTQHEATPTQKSARKCAATSRDFLREILQSAFTLVNQLSWIAQYKTYFTHDLNRQERSEAEKDARNRKHRLSCVDLQVPLQWIYELSLHELRIHELSSHTEISAIIRKHGQRFSS